MNGCFKYLALSFFLYDTLDFNINNFIGNKMIIKTLYLARDTDLVCLFENFPVQEIMKDGFAFIDTKSQWFSELKDVKLKESLKIGDIIEIQVEK